MFQQPNSDSDILVGQKEIMNFLKLNKWPSVLRLKKKGLPIKKIESRWMSRKSMILDWLAKQILDDNKGYEKDI
jgi:hypothetical protein